MNTCHIGDCRDSMRKRIADGIRVQTCVTSPPYFGLRSYLPDGHQDKSNELGLEQTPQEYVSNMVEVFRLVRELLADDGTCWINLGDSYASNPASGGKQSSAMTGGEHKRTPVAPYRRPEGLKPKDLIGIPWAVATALRDPYYAGRITRERDRTWMAAMVDGEGTICGFHHFRADDGSPRTGVNIAITNSNIPLLDEANRIWPTSRSEHMRSGEGHLGNRAVFRWIVHGAENKIMFLREMYPYLIAKKRQALVAYNLLLMMRDSKKNGHSSERDVFRDKRKSLTDLLSDLNQCRNVDLPSWLIEPPSPIERGLYLRQDIIWHKPNPMPESVTDRCTKAHEYIFLLSKSERYFFDHEAIKEPAECTAGTVRFSNRRASGMAVDASGNEGRQSHQQDARKETRNKRSVWEVVTHPYSGAHFATFPPALIEPCILAGSRPGDIVFDPFLGSGTTAQVAQNLGRQWIGCELNESYVGLQRERVKQQGLVFA